VNVNECIWRRPWADAPIKDKRIITISAPSKERYLIDFDVTMEMLMDVKIGKTNHSRRALPGNSRLMHQNKHQS
jgi:hypothetical protein